MEKTKTHISISTYVLKSQNLFIKIKKISTTSTGFKRLEENGVNGENTKDWRINT